MGYWNDLCDECGKRADKISAMYCLCHKCASESHAEDEDVQHG